MNYFYIFGFNCKQSIHMKNNFKILIVLFLSAFSFSSCSSDDAAESNGTTTGDYFPMAVNNKWEYTNDVDATEINLIGTTSFGGNNFGPSPYQLLSAGLAACTAMTIQMYARRKKWEVSNVTVHINYSKEHSLDCENCESDTAKIDTFKRGITLEGSLSDEQKKRLLEIADRCPVHRTLHSETQVITRLIE